MSSPTTCGASNATVCLSSDDFGYSFDAETMLGQQHDNLLPFQDATTSTSMVALGVLMLLIRYSRSLVFEPALARLGVRLGEYTHGSAWVAQHTEQMHTIVHQRIHIAHFGTAPHHLRHLGAGGWQAGRTAGTHDAGVHSGALMTTRCATMPPKLTPTTWARCTSGASSTPSALAAILLRV